MAYLSCQLKIEIKREPFVGRLFNPHQTSAKWRIHSIHMGPQGQNFVHGLASKWISHWFNELTSTKNTWVILYLKNKFSEKRPWKTNSHIVCEEKSCQFASSCWVFCRFCLFGKEKKTSRSLGESTLVACSSLMRVPTSCRAWLLR